jgi:hypothetical protein
MAHVDAGGRSETVRFRKGLWIGCDGRALAAVVKTSACASLAALAGCLRARACKGRRAGAQVETAAPQRNQPSAAARPRRHSLPSWTRSTRAAKSFSPGVLHQRDERADDGYGRLVTGAPPVKVDHGVAPADLHERLARSTGPEKNDRTREDPIGGVRLARGPVGVGHEFDIGPVRRWMVLQGQQVRAVSSCVDVQNRLRVMGIL